MAVKTDKTDLWLVLSHHLCVLAVEIGHTDCARFAGDGERLLAAVIPIAQNSTVGAEEIGAPMRLDLVLGVTSPYNSRIEWVMMGSGSDRRPGME
jgi:hypothetical protein